MDLLNMPLLIKVQEMYHRPHLYGRGHGSTGHLENISDNMPMGAVNAFNGDEQGLEPLHQYLWCQCQAPWLYKAEGILISIVVAEGRIMVKVQQTLRRHGTTLLECTRHFGEKLCRIHRDEFKI